MQQEVFFDLSSKSSYNPLQLKILSPQNPMNTGTKYADLLDILGDISGIVENLLLLLSDKEKTVVIRRFDLDGKGKSTLEEVGQEFSVTRERIRQIEKSALNKMRRNVFNSALKELHIHVADRVRQHGGLCSKSVLVMNLEDVAGEGSSIHEGCLDLALVLHEDLDSVGNTINFHPYLRAKDLADYSLKHASNQLVNQMHKYGDTKEIAKIHKDLEKFFEEIGFDSRKIRSLIDIDKRLTLVDGKGVGLMEWRHIHPRTLRDKIGYVLRETKKPMHFADIAERIREAAFDNRTVNVQAVHNELIRHKSFVLIGRGIYALAEWGYEKGTVAEVIERILGDGAEMSQDEIVEAVLDKRQVKKITVVLALKNSEKFERTGRKMYKLKF